MTSKWKIGVLTGGGDVPGLNSCIRAFTYRAIDDGHEVLGIRCGWRGVASLNPDDPPSMNRWLMTLGKIQVRTVDRHGGTFLHTSRTNPISIKRKDLPEHLKSAYADAGAGIDPEQRFDITPHVLKALERLGITHLVTIGGDDTLSYAARLNREGYPVVAVPKTMDNDVMGTDYCIGFSTAVTRSVNLITELRTPVGSHERIGVVEVFGRYSGETALFSGYLSSVDRTVISEVQFDMDRLAALLVEDKRANPSHYAMVVVSEGATMAGGGGMVIGGEEDAFGHRKLGGIGDVVGHEIKRITGENVMVQRLAYLMRSGAPDSLDRLVAYNFGNLAYELIAGGQKGQMVAIHDGRYTTVPVEIASSGRRSVNVREFYDAERYLPKISSVRGKPMFLY